MLQEVAKIHVIDDEEERWKEQFTELKGRMRLPLEEYHVLLEKNCAFGKETAQKEKEKIKAFEKEESELTAKLAKAEDHNKLFERLNEAEELYEQLKEAEKALKKATNEAEKQRKSKEPFWQEKRMAANQALVQVKELEQKELEKREKEEEVTQLNQVGRKI